MVKKLVKKIGHWLGIISDEDYASWLNEPEQKKLWAKCDIIPATNTNQPKKITTPLIYDPAIAELPPELMFMHEAVMAENEKVEDVELKFPEFKGNWWDELAADENIISRGQTKKHDYRVNKYLDESTKENKNENVNCCRFDDC